jgi:Na+/melibiose symporter-like transporter
MDNDAAFSQEDDMEGGEEEDKLTTISDYVRLLRENKTYRILFLSYCIDNCGNWLTIVACIGIIEDLGAGALNTSIFFVCRLLPAFVFAGVLGPIADRYNKQSLLIMCSLGAALSVLLIIALLPAAAMSGKFATLLLVFGASLAQFTFSALYEPVRSSMLPLVVNKADLIVATSLDGE